MKKTFSLGVRQWLYIFMGVMFLLNGIIGYFKEEPMTIEYWLMVLNLSFGSYAFIYGLIVSFDLMGLSPKVVVTSEGVLLKSKPFSSGKELSWDEVKAITFHSYQMDFKLETEPVFFDYNCSANTSMKIKEAIRDMAEMKQIPVTGG
jgi:hypothetical protein